MGTKHVNTNASTGAGTDLANIPTSVAGAIIAAMHGQDRPGLDVPRPFAHPICLVPMTRVAGTSHIKDIGELAKRLSEGDRLRLERDAGNPYDQWAIRVFDDVGNRIGFVAADINEIPARLMDGGKQLFAEVTDVELVGRWWRIGIGVWLDD